MFMLTAHSKFYTAINAVAIAPCVMGKSNLYRRSDLDEAVWKKLGTAKRGIQGLGGATVNAIANTNTNPPTLTHFSQYIAEDNMIALCLWENGNGSTQITPDPAIQPSQTSLSKDTGIVVSAGSASDDTWSPPPLTSNPPPNASVPLSLALSPYLSSSQAPSGLGHTLLPISPSGAPSTTTTSTLSPRSSQSKTLLQNHTLSTNTFSVSTALCSSLLKTWLPVWICREALAFPIWLTAMCGHSIYWRNKPFRILNDLSTEEVPDH